MIDEEEEEEEEEDVGYFHIINYEIDCDIQFTSSNKLFKKKCTLS